MQVSQIGKWPSDPDDFDEDEDSSVTKLASQVRKEALHLIEALNLSIPIVTKLRSLLNRMPDHSLPDILASITKSSTEEKLKVKDDMISWGKN